MMGEIQKIRCQHELRLCRDFAGEMKTFLEQCGSAVLQPSFQKQIESMFYKCEDLELFGSNLSEWQTMQAPLGSESDDARPWIQTTGEVVSETCGLRERVQDSLIQDSS